MAGRPVLFLDVDGTLIPFGGSGWPSAVLDRLNPDHGPRLLALPCDLMWATTWMDDANEVIGPRLGLPELPVVDFPDDENDARLHWKTRCLVEQAAGRPFVWVDDEITDADRRWVDHHHRGPALLHRVDPGQGLTEADFATVAAWLASSPGAAAAR